MVFALQDWWDHVTEFVGIVILGFGGQPKPGGQLCYDRM